jgi:hypothetical protein
MERGNLARTKEFFTESGTKILIATSTECKKEFLLEYTSIQGTWPGSRNFIQNPDSTIGQYVISNGIWINKDCNKE